MRLLMYISNDLIDSISLESDKITVPGYISSFTRMLKEKHDNILRQSAEEPEFLVQGIKVLQQPNLETH